MYEKDNLVRGELAHYGILGMKWGKVRSKVSQSIKDRKARSEEFQKKAANVANNKSAQPSDVKRAKYARDPVAKRIAKTAGGIIARDVLTEVLFGDISKYAGMSKKDITKKVTDIAVRTAANVAIQDALAKSAMKNYTDKGTVVKGTKRSKKILTKEDLIESGISVGVAAAYVGAYVGGRKLSQIAKDKNANKARFEKWGANILTQKVDNVIWTDGNTAVIDNRRR